MRTVGLAEVLSTSEVVRRAPPGIRMRDDGDCLPLAEHVVLLVTGEVVRCADGRRLVSCKAHF